MNVVHYVRIIRHISTRLDRKILERGEIILWPFQNDLQLSLGWVGLRHCNCFAFPLIPGRHTDTLNRAPIYQHWKCTKIHKNTNTQTQTVNLSYQACTQTHHKGAHLSALDNQTLSLSLSLWPSFSTTLCNHQVILLHSTGSLFNHVSDSERMSHDNPSVGLLT